MGRSLVKIRKRGENDEPAISSVLINQFREDSPDILRKDLINLHERMLNINTTITSAQNIHAVIEFLLIILTAMPKGIIQHGRFFELSVRVKALYREVLILVRDLEMETMNEESSNATGHATLVLLENIELLKTDLKHIFLKAPIDSSQICFPMSDGPLFLHLLLRNLNDLLNSNDYSVALIKKEIRLVKDELEFITSYFGNVERELNQNLWTSVLDVAYEAERFINSILLRSDHFLLQLIFLLPDTVEKIKIIKEKVLSLPENISKNRGNRVVNSPNKRVVCNSTSLAGKVIVGFEEETKLIIGMLINGPDEVDVISIFGMPGAGKTMLASRVYNDKFVASHFDARAWCTIDQECNEKKFWQSIFNQIIGLKETFTDSVIDNDIADKLRKELLAKRYLIVLDDVWDTKTWDELTMPFPEFEKRSRIILTSREKEVAWRGKRYSDPLHLRLFKVEESWKLLQKRVFGEESCPHELLHLGTEIARNCGGLPLVADLIAGVIAKKEKSKNSWREVLNNLNSFGLNSEVDAMMVIQLSYDRLPDHLKPCMLYLASYPKDTTIKVNDLKSFWTAEGFVEQTDVKSVEKVLDNYLDGLISSSLVMGFYRLGVMETCQIHDLVQDFCLVKAREEKFFSYSAADQMPRRIIMASYQHHCDSHGMFNSENESIREACKHLLTLKVRNGLRETNQVRHSRLLRVLCLPNMTLSDSFLNEIGHLIHLRYLHVKVDSRVESLPLSWSHLWNLETLLVDNNRKSKMVLLPRIWNLAKLQHLSIFRCSFFDSGFHEPIQLAKDVKLDYLRTLGRVTFYSQDEVDILKRFSHLQSLKCTVVTFLRNWFPKLDLLHELEELEAYRLHRIPENQCDYHFPRSLKKLTLKSFRMSSDSLSAISRLPNLQQLILRNIRIRGDTLNMGEDDTFESLKYLEFSYITLSEWVVGEESFPVLEELNLQNCMKLQEIPSCFGDIISLNSIQVTDCPRRLEDSVKKIKEYVEEMAGEDKLQVLIHNFWPPRTVIVSI